VLRQCTAQGLARVDFQRTRSAIGHPESRFYNSKDFDVLAACLHAVSERWDYKYVCTSQLDPHSKYPGKLSNLVRVDDRWSGSVKQVLTSAAAG
jgi:hypothetical protein